MTWRLSGLNWEGRRWDTPPSIRSFAAQVDADYPDRPRATDGTVASRTHDQLNPVSDHRPYPWTGPGTVRGIDVSVTPEMGDQITEALRASRDVRIKYVIWNRRSFRPPSWEWVPYGLAPHDKHFHLSTVALADPDGSLWQLKGDPDDMDFIISVFKGQNMAFYRALQAKTGAPGGLADYWGSDYTGQKPNDAEWRAAIDDLFGAALQAGVFTTPGKVGLTEADVKAIINQSEIVAP